ncbi:MAG: hypothetical protein ABGW92_01680 [Methanocaldococcus sp.]
MSGDSNPKNELKLKMYETFRSHIERAENSFWTYMLFYLQFLIGLNGVVGILCRYLDKLSVEIIAFLALVNILLSFIEIIVIIERGKWFFRNMILTVNLEKNILKEEHIILIPKIYSKFDNFNKVIDTMGEIFIALFIAIYIISIIVLGCLANSPKIAYFKNILSVGVLFLIVWLNGYLLLEWINKKIKLTKFYPYRISHTIGYNDYIFLLLFYLWKY